MTWGNGARRLIEMYHRVEVGRVCNIEAKALTVMRRCFGQRLGKLPCEAFEMLCGIKIGLVKAEHVEEMASAEQQTFHLDICAIARAVRFELDRTR